MIRKLMAGSAVIALISAGAFTASAAETQTNPPALEQDAAAATPAIASDATLTPEQPTLASVFIGRSVYSSVDPESDNIGDVNDLIVGEDGGVTHAVVGVGGFLGIGEKDVAVPFGDLQVVQQDGDIRLIYAATREQLEAAPALDRTAFDPIARYNEEQAALISSQSTGAGAPLAPAPDATADNAATAPVEEETAFTEPAPAEDVTTPADEEQVAATETPPVDHATVAPADEQIAANEPVPATSGAVGFLNAGPDQIRATFIVGKTVYGPQDESIGDVSDLVLQHEGNARAALVDVGGFLGVGEKVVAIPFDQLKLSFSEGNPEPQVKIALSKEELAQLPTYESPADSTAAVDQPLPADNIAAAPATDPMAEPDTAASDAMAEPDVAEDVAEDVPMDADTMATGSIAVPYEPATQDVSASDLLGASVYGPDESSIGEISDLLLSSKGDIEGVVVDVGGFLGIGEKPVAVEFNSLKLRTDEGGTMTAMIDATQEQLDSAPTYEAPVENAASIQ